MKLLFIKDTMSYYKYYIFNKLRTLRDWLKEPVELDHNY